MCDVVLVLPGPRRIPAHRIVLSSASDYFSAMFTSDVLEATQNEVNMKDVDPDAMTALVKYMYDGESECLYAVCIIAHQVTMLQTWPQQYRKFLLMYL